jgi:hypothetical protein
MEYSDMMLVVAWLISGIVYSNVKVVFVRVICIVVAFVAPVIWLADEVPEDWLFWYAAIAVIVLISGIFRYLMSVAYKRDKPGR